jgi:hypothetical protein
MTLATNREFATATVAPLREVFLDERKILSPFDKRECLSLRKAAEIAGKSESTMRGWCEEHGLGRRIGGGKWSVSKVALTMFLDGNTKALRAYHAGDRSSDLVESYFERAGLSPERDDINADGGRLPVGGRAARCAQPDQASPSGY